jgi:hypothetical protein
VPQHTQIVVGCRDQEDHSERSVVAAEGVEAHEAEVAAGVQYRGVEVFGTVGELEVPAVVDGSRICRCARRPRPSRWAAVPTEGVHHDVTSNGIALIQDHTSGTRRSVLGRQEPHHPNAGSDLDRRLSRRRASERPLDDRSPDPEVDEVLVTRLTRPAELQSQVLRFRSDLQQRLDDIRSPGRQQAPTARQEGVGLGVVGNPSSLHAKGIARLPIRIDEVTLDDDRFVSGPGHGERSRETSDAAAGNDDLHATKLLT